MYSGITLLSSRIWRHIKGKYFNCSLNPEDQQPYVKYTNLIWKGLKHRERQYGCISQLKTIYQTLQPNVREIREK